MICPYCEDTELVTCGYYICPKCKIAMTELELAIAVQANEDADLIAKLTGQRVLKATKQETC